MGPHRRQVVSEVVEAQLAVGHVRHVAAVRRPPVVVLRGPMPAVMPCGRQAGSKNNANFPLPSVVEGAESGNHAQPHCSTGIGGKTVAIGGGEVGRIRS